MSIQSTSLVVILALGAASVYAAHVATEIGNGKLATVEAADATAQAAAVSKAAAIQKAQDALSLKDQAHESAAQVRIVTRTQTITKEVPTYVTVAQDARGCVTYGLVRLHDAAALGVDPSTLQLPAGKSDDDCTSLKASDLAAGIVSNYGVSHQNAEQLNALIADVKARAATYATGASGKTPATPAPKRQSRRFLPTWPKLPHL